MAELLAVLLAVTGLGWALPITCLAVVWHRRAELWDIAAALADDDAQVARRAALTILESNGALAAANARSEAELAAAREVIQAMRRPTPPPRGEHIRQLRRLGPDGEVLYGRVNGEIP